MTANLKFHFVNFNILDDDHEAGFTLLNAEVLGDGKGNIGFPDISIRGFPEYPEKPRLLYDPRSGSEASDLELCRGYWLISERARRFFEEFEPYAFVYHDCDIVRPDGSAGPVRWLCDVVQVVDAIDEQRSGATAIQNFVNKKIYKLSSDGTLALTRAKIGAAKIFHLMYFNAYVFCNDEFKELCIERQLSGFGFGRSTINIYVIDDEKAR